MGTRILNMEGIGAVAFTRRKGSRRISLRVKPDGSVLVNHPWFADPNDVLGFVSGHAAWILDQKQKMAERKFFYQLDEILQIKSTTIKISRSGGNKLEAGVSHGLVVVAVPAHLSVESDEVQHFIRGVVTLVCRKEAKKYLPERTRQLAQSNGFSFHKVFVKNLKSKWGSCSSQQNINLNLSLMLMPDHLIDYIILHELAHLREPNHGPGFWALLNQLTENKAKALDREIRKNYRIL
jgi:hypothetical protein